MFTSFSYYIQCGRSSLFWACKIDVAQLLIIEGANVDVIDNVSIRIALFVLPETHALKDWMTYTCMLILCNKCISNALSLNCIVCNLIIA